MSKRYAVLLIMLSALATVAPVQAQQFTISTDRSVYDYGDTVTIFIQPAPAIGVDYWLIITKPDGSEDRQDLSPGTVDATTGAGPPAGRYTVELWGQVVAPDSNPQAYASCSYEVRGPTPPHFTISTDQSAYEYGDTVTIYIQPTPAMGVDYWLVVTKPDGAQDRLDVSPGTVDVTTGAGPPPGRYLVELWGQVVSPGSGSEVYASCTFEVRGPAPPQFTISADKAVYYYGDTVRIFIQPAPAIGVDYWLIITKPDGSQDRQDLSAGQGTVTAVAGPPPGQYTVDLWGQVVSPGSGPQVYASCSYEVIQPAPPQQFTVSTDQSAYDYGDTVTIYIQPAPAIGVDYWLIITRSDGSQKRIDLSGGQGTANLVASAPAGRWTVDLWGQVVSPGSGSQVYATCDFQVRQPAPPPQFTISTDQSVYDYGDTIKVYIQPVPAIGVSYWLIVTKPDGSQERTDLGAGQGVATLVAAAPPGQYRVELWGQVVSPSSGSQVYASCTFHIRQPATPQQFTISTDKTAYYYGDTVTIYVQPAPAIGVDYWLIITKPDGSQSRVDISAGQATVSYVAGAPPGQYRVELWGQVVAPNSSPQFYAQCSYEVRQPAPTQITVSTDQAVYYYGDTIRISIQPAPAIGVSYWLIIWKPNGSQESINLNAGQGTATTAAGPPPGQYRVELWGQAVAPNTTPQLFAQHSYEVRQQITTVTQPTTVTTVVTNKGAGQCYLRDGAGNCILGCVIATAAYGSEMAAEVVYMRYVRDSLIGSTPTGRALVAAFNTFYYSWSPTVANVIAGNELLRATFRIILLPLLAIIHTTALLFTAVTNATGGRDVGSFIAFLAAAMMTIVVYVILPALAGMKLIQGTRRRRS